MVQYNEVFERFVENEEDLEGLVAYALYKQHKRTWLLEERKRLRRDPSSDETSVFVAGVLTNMDAYRLRASNGLISFAQQYVDQARTEIEHAAVKSAVDDVAERVEIAMGFWRSLAFNIISFLIIAIVLAGIAFFADRAGNDLIDIFSSDEIERSETLLK